MIQQIKKALQQPNYDFLKTNEHLKNKIMFITLGGSYAYGTNVENSDIDIRGCALNSKSDLIGMSQFEQVIDTSTDTVIYAFNKLIPLLLNCNPNCIELLGCKKDHYIYVSPEGKQLLQNYKLFLSQKAVHSFGGYADAQLRRLQNALARDTYPQYEKEKHILNSVKSAMYSFEQRYQHFENGSINLYIDTSQKENLDSEIYMDIALNHYPLRDYKGLWAEMHNIVKDYAKLNGRNHKKDNEHLNKHAMHLIRLYLMCIDILEKQEINTYREKEHDLLMNIRNGKYQNEYGTFQNEFFEMVDEYQHNMEQAMKHTALPKTQNYKKVEEFVMDINEKVITGECG